ncbi:hypothetical protein HGA13_11685 [Nocardia speluncae]|uniref:NERD domain-containing protein n=1 Tax=Nocardia speluncae TaxID=419477 RepID=A0A846XIU5_9NOCA|nr:hypothetical protein [Nocardia speluncae]NKY33734.1 hypothetical protein [Nocardia speluncae]
MIVRVQSAELSGVQRFVLRLIGDWGAGSERVGGIALLGCPLPRPRRRSTTTADLLIWTPYGCTLVLLADFGSVQHGVLDTPSAGRWQVGERAADLRTGSGAVNPLHRARRQRAELAAVFRRAGVPEQIELLVVLIPKTGSRITWNRPPQEPGEETIMVRIGQSTGFAEYFQRPPDRPVRWRAADIAQAFSALGVPLSAPDPAEAADEGFVVTAADTMIGAPTPAQPASPSRKAGVPLFGGARRRAAQPDIVFPGPVVDGAAERAEYAEAAPGPGATGIPEKRALQGTAPSYRVDREPASGRAEASGERPPMASVPWHGHSGASVSEFDTTGFDGADADADIQQSSSAERSVVPGRPGSQETTGDYGETGSERLPGTLSERTSPPVSEVLSQRQPAAQTAGGQEPAAAVADPADVVVSGPRPAPGPRHSGARLGAASPVERPLPAAGPRSYSEATDIFATRAPIDGAPVGHAPVEHPAEHAPEGPGSWGRSPERFSDRALGSTAADNRSRRKTGAVRMSGLRDRLLRTAAGAEDAPRPYPFGAAVHGEGSAEEPRTGAGTARAGVSTGGPAEQPETGAPGPGVSRSAQVAGRVERGLTGFRQVRDRRRDRGMVARTAGGPRRPDHEQVADPQASVHRRRGAVAGRPGEKGGGGRGARYAAAVGATGAVLAVAAGTVFAASGFARFEVAEYGALCRGGGGTTVAAPYAVAGPSPVHLAGKLSEISTFGPSAVWHPVDARSVQLVACVSEGRLGQLVRTCQYPPAPDQPVGRTLNLFTMAYRLSVYEARTGNRLAAIDLTGEQFAADPAVTEPDECRAAGGAPEEGLPGRRHSRLSHQQIQRALAPFVTPAAPHIQAAR